MTGDGADFLVENFGEWLLSFSRWSFGDEGASLTVEVALEGLPRARLSLAHGDLEDEAAVGVLREKARRWIVDYESRPDAFKAASEAESSQPPSRAA